MISKTYISPQQLLDDAYELGLKVLESQYLPTLLVGVWRGGTPVAIAMQELMDYLGAECDHIAIKTRSYTGIGERSKTVRVHGLTYLVKRLESEHSLLIVDDVHDSGLSIEQTIIDIKRACKKNTPEIRVATPYYKPANNKTERVPDYYIHESSEWLVFPHELEGLTAEELKENRPHIAHLIDEIEVLKTKP